MDGFLNIIKPPGMTSSDVVALVRRQLPRGTRVGHGGTLDPDAAGVLPVCVGRAARLFDYIIDKQKTYVAVLRLGIETDTQDASGAVLRACDPSGVTGDALRAAMAAFVGEIWQTPPAYSALKQGGVRLYELARRGETPDIPPRRVTVDGIDLLGPEGEGAWRVAVRCRKGVYIRTLCHDIGRTLGVGGHMAALVRTRAGAFDLRDGLTVEELAAAQGRFEPYLSAMDMPLGHYPAIEADEALRPRLLTGAPLERDMYRGEAAPGDVVRVYAGGAFAGMAEVDDQGTARFRAMLLERES